MTTTEKYMKGEVIFRGVISAMLVLLTVLVSLVAYLAKLQVEEIKSFNREVNSRVSALERESEVTKATTFTLNRWLDAKNILDSTIATQDKRIQRTEDAIVVIDNGLKEILSEVKALRNQK